MVFSGAPPVTRRYGAGVSVVCRYGDTKTRVYAARRYGDTKTRVHAATGGRPALVVGPPNPLGTTEIVRTRFSEKSPPSRPPHPKVCPQTPVTSEFVRTRRSANAPPRAPRAPPTARQYRGPSAAGGGPHENPRGRRHDTEGGRYVSIGFPLRGDL